MKVSQSGKCQELWKFLQVQSQKPPSAMMKLDPELPELPLLQRIRSLELPASEIAAQINASQSSSNRHISTSTVQRRLHESGIHGQIAAKKPLPKDTNNKKRLAWAKKHEQWTLDTLWSHSPHQIWVRPLNRSTFTRPQDQTDYQDVYCEYALTNWQVSLLTFSNASCPSL